MGDAAEKISVPAEAIRRAARSSEPVFQIGSAWRQGAYRFERSSAATTWILSCLMRGRQCITTADGEARSQGFRLRLIRPGVAYRADTVNGGSYWCIFKPEPAWASLLNWPAVLPGIMYLDVADATLRRQIPRLLQETQAMVRANHPQAWRLVRNVVERILLLADAINPQAEHATRDARVQQAVAYIGRHVNQNLRAAVMARHVHLSPSRLAHLFQQQMGQSPKQFHDRCRIHEACELLRHTGLPVKEIASELGYANAYHFSRRFRRWVGQSPRAYRQQAMA